MLLLLVPAAPASLPLPLSLPLPYKSAVRSRSCFRRDESSSASGVLMPSCLWMERRTRRSDLLLSRGLV